MGKWDLLWYDFITPEHVCVTILDSKSTSRDFYITYCVLTHYIGVIAYFLKSADLQPLRGGSGEPNEPSGFPAGKGGEVKEKHKCFISSLSNKCT